MCNNFLTLLNNHTNHKLKRQKYPQDLVEPPWQTGGEVERQRLTNQNSDDQQKPTHGDGESRGIGLGGGGSERLRSHRLKDE